MYVTHQRSKLKRLMNKLEKVQQEEMLIRADIQELVRKSTCELESYYRELLDTKVKTIFKQRVNN